MKHRLFILCIFVAVVSSVSGQHLTMKNYQTKITHRLSLIHIANHPYCDKDPITNLDWREYLFWLEQTYGKDSEQYRAALPDEEVLQQQMPDSLVWYYLHHPMHNNSIVLGVSPEQARAYCQWRTDRVAEQMLWYLKILPKDHPFASFVLADYDNPKKLKFLYFFLPKDDMETCYGFFCFAEWR